MLKRARSDVGSTPDEGMLYTPPARSLRQKLLDAKATDAEINKALIDAAKNREAFKKLMSPGEGGLLKLPSPGCPANGGLPGPYDNDFFRGLSKNAIDIIFNDIKIFFNNDMRAYVPTFFGPHARPLTPNDPEYDHVAMAEYDFVMRQVEYILTLSQSDDEEIQELSSQLWLRIMKPGTIVLSRDADSRLSLRERKIIDSWLESDKGVDEPQPPAPQVPTPQPVDWT